MIEAAIPEKVNKACLSILLLLNFEIFMVKVFFIQPNNLIENLLTGYLKLDQNL